MVSVSTQRCRLGRRTRTGIVGKVHVMSCRRFSRCHLMSGRPGTAALMHNIPAEMSSEIIRLWRKRKKVPLQLELFGFAFFCFLFVREMNASVLE